jgi:hypothetical protein
MMITALLTLPVALAQDSVFTTPAGQQLSLSSLQGKVVLMVFSGVQDPQCREEFKLLTSLAERYNSKPVALFWVSINPMNAQGNDQLKTSCGPAGSVSVLRDPSQAAFKRFTKGQNQIPVIVILDQKGQAYGEPLGGFNPDSDYVNTLAGVIDSLLSQAK